MTDTRVAALTVALDIDWRPFWDEEQITPFVHEATFNHERYAVAVLAALDVAGWTLTLIEGGMTNQPPPRLVEELYP